MTDSTEKKYTIRIPPCPAYDVEGTESWLTDLAEEGLLLSRDGFFMGFAYFERSEPQHMKYRLEASQKETGFWSADDSWGPDDEAVALSEEYGWEFVTNRGQFFIYRSREPGTRELNTDPEVQALALKAVQKRQSTAVFRALFWGILYPLAYMKGNIFMTMISMGTWFFLYGAALLIWNFTDTLIEYFHLRSLRQRLIENGTIDHQKNWRKKANLYHLKNALNLVLIVAWFIILLTRWSAEIMEEDVVQLADYTGDPPFATMADLAGENHSSFHYTAFGYGNTMRQWSDWISPVNYDWREIAEIRRADGTLLDGGLYIHYHETIHPWIAEQLAEEYVRHDKWNRISAWGWRDANSFEYIEAPELPVDSVIAYLDEIHMPNLVMVSGSKVIHVAFSQFSPEHTMPMEEWAAIIAESLLN